MATTTSAVPTADAEYDKLNDPNKPTPTPPVHAARLSALVKNLASAESAVSESIKARRGLIEGLEKIIESNRAALTKEEAQKETLTSSKNAMESRKRDVEDGIMRGLSAESTPFTAHSPVFGSKTNDAAPPSENASVEPERPDIEELTPPPESRPETKSPAPASTIEHRPASNDPRRAPQAPSAPPQAGADLLSSLSMPQTRPYAGHTGGTTPKKRKLDDDIPDFGGGEDAMADLDEDVAELLRAESSGGR